MIIIIIIIIMRRRRMIIIIIIIIIIIMIIIIIIIIITIISNTIPSNSNGKSKTYFFRSPNLVFHHGSIQVDTLRPTLIGRLYASLGVLSRHFVAFRHWSPWKHERSSENRNHGLKLNVNKRREGRRSV